MRIGIYMGSFNPPHKGHISVINYLLDNDYVDRVLIVPTLNYWDKNDLADITDRIKMLEFFENDKIQVDKEHNKYIYTYELLRELKKVYPNDELYLVIGADNIINFHKWKHFEELLQNKIIVMNRDNVDINSYIEKLGGNNFIVVSDFPFVDVSSTEIREKNSNEYLDEKVLTYIKKHHLYGR